MSDRCDSIIRVRRLTAGYDDRDVLRDVTFEVIRGEIFFILGGSGSGKSTLMKNMIGLYRPRKGAILINGRDIVSAEGVERQEVLRQFGVMYQNGALFGSMTLMENTRLPLEEWTDMPLEAMNIIAKMKLQLVGLEDFAFHMPAEISGGMQKRAALARAMALDPEILFLDEPTSGLDPILSADLDRLILRLSQTLGITFVVVSHALPSVYSIAERVILLGKETGAVIAAGRPQDLRNHEDKGVREFMDPREDVQCKKEWN